MPQLVLVYRRSHSTGPPSLACLTKRREAFQICTGAEHFAPHMGSRQGPACRSPALSLEPHQLATGLQHDSPTPTCAWVCMLCGSTSDNTMFIATCTSHRPTPLPQQLVWSAGAAAEPTLALVLCIIYYTANCLSTWCLTHSSTANTGRVSFSKPAHFMVVRLIEIGINGQCRAEEVCLKNCEN